MIKVLQVLPRLRRGGSQTFVMNLYRNIDRTKVQFGFIVFSEERDEFYNEIISMGGEVFFFEKFNGINYFKIKKDFSRFLDKHTEYQIIHFHVYTTANLYIDIAKKHGLKTIVHSHSTSNGKNLKSIVKYFFQKPLKRKADMLFACSDEAGQWLFGKKAMLNSNYFFIPNGIDINKFRFNLLKRKEIRSYYNIQNKKVIGHVGSFQHPKNHKFLLSVFNEICKNDKSFVLMLVGDGYLKCNILKQIKNYHLEDSVILVGNVPNVFDYLNSFDVFAFPSLWEGLPLSVIEAQVSGLNCIISNNITKNVCVTNFISYLNLKSKSEWANEIIKKSFIDRTADRFNENNLALQFDIKNVAIKIENLYETSLIENENIK